jgi:iron complex outermembrane receptor protein
VFANVGLGVRDFGAADFYGPYPSYERTRTGTAALRYESRRDRPWALHASLSSRRHSDVFTLVRDDPALYQNRHVSWQSTAELVTRYTTAGPWRLAVGGEAMDLQLASERLGDRRERRGGFFLEATRERTDGATLNGGVRVDHSSAYGSFVSPSAAVAVPVSRAIALRGSASRGFRSPTWTERYYEDPANIGDPTLRPERFLAAEVGLGFLTSGPVSADVAAFVRDAESVIEWAKPSGADATTPWRTMNVAAATYHGIETGLEARNLVGADWRLHAMALRLETRGAAGFVGKYALRPVTGTIGLSVSVPVFQRVLLHMDGVHVTRSGEGSHVLASARLACHWRTFSATVDVLNLADAVYQDAAAKPAAGRAVYISGRWNLP